MPKHSIAKQATVKSSKKSKKLTVKHKEKVDTGYIRVLGKLYEVIPFSGVSDLVPTNAAGANDVRSQKIAIDCSNALSQVQDTMLHEIIHIIDYDFQLDLSERQVHCMASGIYSVLRDNEDFAKWLLK